MASPGDECLDAFKNANHSEAVRLLPLVREPKDLFTQTQSRSQIDPERLGLLHLAVKNGWLDVVKDLINNYNFEPTRGGSYVCTAHIAVGYNHLDIVKYLITECSCDPNLLMVADDCQLTSLQSETSFRRCACISNGRNCLHIAVENNHFDIVKYLITECRCDPMVTVTAADGQSTLGRNRLYSAAVEMYMYLNFLITKRTLDLDSNGRNCLHIAVENDHFDILKYLINECSCEPMVADKNGMNCLHIAAEKNCFDIVKYLIIECSCDPMVADKNGMNCLHIAAEKDCFDIVKYLITECSCDPMVADENRRNCLHFAVKQRNYAVIEYLLSSGLLDLLAKDNHKKTPLKYAERDPDILSLFNKFDDIKTSHPVDSYVNVLLLGNPGAGKSTLAQVIIERANGTFLLGQFRSVKGVESCTAGIVPTKLQHKELGNIILHDFAGHSEYYSSHTAVIENLLQGSGAVFVIVVDVTSEDSTKHLQQWLTVVNNEVHKCIDQCQIIIVVSHVDQMANTNERIDKLSDIVDSMRNSQVSLASLDCRKLGGSNLLSLLDKLSSSCMFIRSKSVKNLSLYCHMMYALLEKNEENILSLSDILNLPSDNYILPSEREEILEVLTSLHSTGLICLLKSHDDPNKVWVVVNKQALLADLNGILFAPKSFKQFRNIASNTGIITVPSFIGFFPQYDPDMLICFLKHMELCQEINPQFLTMTNLKANSDEGEDKLLFFPTLLSIERPKSTTGRVFKFGWYLQCTKDYHFFPSYYFHILVLHLAFNYSSSKNSSKFDRQCTFWKNGIHWFDGNGVETLVEMVDNSQCILVLMSCREGYEEKMVSLLSTVIKKVMQLQSESCPSIKPSKLILDPNELKYPIDKPTQRTVYNVTDILTSIEDKRDFVISEIFQDDEKLPKEIEIKNILKSITVTQLKSILEGHHLKGSTPPSLSPSTLPSALPLPPPLIGSKVTQNLLNTGDLDDVLTFLKSHQFANHQWQDLGLHMGLYRPTLEDIDDKCRGDPHKCLRECLAAWLKGEDKVMSKGGPSWTSLADALRVIGERRMANNIQTSETYMTLYVSLFF